MLLLRSFIYLSFIFFIYSANAGLQEIKNEFNNNHSLKYIICADGDGSSFKLSVLNRSLQPIPLYENNKTSSKSNFVNIDKSANINTIKDKAMEKLFSMTFNKIKIREDKDNGKITKLSQILKDSIFIGSFAGAGSIINQTKIQNILLNSGLDQKHIFISSDADLAIKLLELQKMDGVVLIAGTGSIAKSTYLDSSIKEYRTQIRGGFGWVLGDEGSGFHIGKLAINTASEYERDLDAEDMLNEGKKNLHSVTDKIDERDQFIKAIKHAFQKSKMIDIRQEINSSVATHITKIAKLAPEIFNLAYEKNNRYAMEIINTECKNLATLITNSVKYIPGKNNNITVFLMGGIFKNAHEKEFIKNLSKELQLKSDKKFTFSLENKAMSHVPQDVVQYLFK